MRIIAASSLAFPGNKPLATWRRLLAPFAPRDLWVGHLLLHRLEVLAEISEPEKTDPLTLLVLHALSLVHAANHRPYDPDWLPHLDERLHLGPAILQQLVHGLQNQALLTPHTSLTELGRQVLSSGHLPRRLWKRRQLTFMERLRPDGERLLPPHYLPLQGGSGPPWHPDDAGGFHLDWLFASSQQSAAWKDQWDFPRNVLNVADPAQPGDVPPPWQRVVVDRPERQSMVLATSGLDDKLLGFAVRPEGWELNPTPVLTLPAPARAEFPELSMAADFWHHAWLAFAKARALPDAEAQAARLRLSGLDLHVAVAPALHARLTAAKSDLLKPDNFLLGGEGYLRAVVQVHIVSQ